jgi:hypothetical protein
LEVKGFTNFAGENAEAQRFGDLLGMDYQRIMEISAFLEICFPHNHEITLIRHDMDTAGLENTGLFRIVTVRCLGRLHKFWSP